MIAGAMWFNSGILLFADAETDFRGTVRPDSHTILSKHYGAHTGGACSVFVLSAGCDCEGPAAPLGHRVMHDRYTAARSMDTLDLTHVFSIATETLDAVRATYPACGKCGEMIVMYANGHLSNVQHMFSESPAKRDEALTALGRT